MKNGNRLSENPAHPLHWLGSRDLSTLKLADKNRMISPNAIKIPRQYGWIDETFKGGSEKLIIYIKDATANQDASVKQAYLVENLLFSYGINLVFLEGGSHDGIGNVDSRFHMTPGQRIADARKKFDEGETLGVHFLYRITDYPLDIRGMEDRSLYEAVNFRLFGKIDAMRPDARRTIGLLKREIDQKIKLFFNSRLCRWMVNRNKFHENDNLDEYGIVLFEEANNLKIDLSTYPDFNQFCEVNRMDKRILIFDMDRYTALYNQLDFKIIYNQICELEEEIHGRLISGKDEERLDTFMKQVTLIDDFISLGLTPAEYEHYLSIRNDINVAGWPEFFREIFPGEVLGDIDISSVENIIPVVEELYYICIERAHVFVERAIDHIENSRGNCGIMVAGGFHAPTLGRLLRNKDISYAMISPVIQAPTQPGMIEKVLRKDIQNKIKNDIGEV
jgi:hypothetical protein